MKRKDYREKRFENPHRPPHKHARGVVVRIAMLGAGIAALVAALYWTLFSGAFGVHTIAFQGNVRTEEEALRGYTDTLLNRRRFLIFNPRLSLFLIDTARLRERLIERFAFTNVRVAPTLPHTLIILIEERTPSYSVRGPGDALLIDAEGIVIGRADATADTQTRLTLTLQTLKSTTTGERLFEISAMQFLNDVRDALPSITQGYQVTELNLERVLVHDITAKTTEPWVIFMTDTLHPKLQFLNVDRALIEMKDERKKIKYIDVRLPNKIFYK